MENYLDMKGKYKNLASHIGGDYFCLTEYDMQGSKISNVSRDQNVYKPGLRTAHNNKKFIDGTCKRKKTQQSSYTKIINKILSKMTKLRPFKSSAYISFILLIIFNAKVSAFETHLRRQLYLPARSYSEF